MKNKREEVEQRKKSVIVTDERLEKESRSWNKKLNKERKIKVVYSEEQEK